MSEFVKGSYDGPKDLEEYNKFAKDKDKLVIIQEKIGNVYDNRKVYGEEQLEKLLKGVHGE